MNLNIKYPLPTSDDQQTQNPETIPPQLNQNPVQSAANYVRQQVNHAYGLSSSNPQVVNSNKRTVWPMFNTQDVKQISGDVNSQYLLPSNQKVGYTTGITIEQEPLNPNQNVISGGVEQPDKTIADIKKQLLRSSRKLSNKPAHKLKPFVMAMLAGFIFIAVNYNEVAVAQLKQYISPGSSLTTPLIIDPSSTLAIGPEPMIIIPKINVEVPVVYDIKTYDEKQIQSGLERGVIHYGDTALPGENGNLVIVGHSSNNFFNSGKYKFAFVLLDRINQNDTFILNYRGERYVYRVFNKQVIEPDDFSLIQPTNQPITTLITCTPPGTSWHRLVIQGEQIMPDPDLATQTTGSLPDNIDSPVPGNAPSFWQTFLSWF